MTDNAIELAHQRAQAAWIKAGKSTPCYDLEYMRARKALAEAYRQAGIIQ
jgi:hypothetical protein